METRLTLGFLILIFTIATGATGCATRQPKPDVFGPPVQEAAPPSIEIQGPPAPPPQAEVFGPAAVPGRKGIVVVLGPGFAHGFAHAGILKALRDAKIPIAAAYGTEMGALMAALFSLTKTNNEFEWALLKFKPEIFEPKTGILKAFSRGPLDGKAIENALSQTLGDKDLNQARFPTWIGTQVEQAPKWASSGNAATELRAALAVPGWMKALELETGLVTSSALSEPAPVVVAKRQYSLPVIWFDLLSGSQAHEEGVEVLADAMIKQAQLESGQADLILTPQLSDLGLTEYSQKTELIFRGKKLVQDNLTQIKALLGHP